MVKKKFFDWLMWIVGVVASIGIGGLFVNGTFLNVVILNWLPKVIHQIVGYAIIITAVWALLVELYKHFK